MPTNQQPNPDPQKPVLYFDGGCPVCAREVAMYRAQPGGENVCWVDVTRCEAAELGPDLTREAALARIHLRRPDGGLISGAAAFAALWPTLPRWVWLGRAFRSGIALRMLEAGYRAFLFIRRVWRKRQAG